MTALFIFYIFCLFLSFSICVKHPTIGILMQEMDYDWADIYPNKTAYIAASYVKAVEASGARVVPIFIDREESYYRTILNSVNGLVLPGGSATCGPDHGYCHTVKKMYEIIIEMNRNDDYFPVLAVCLGFEVLLQVSHNMIDIQTRCNIFHKSFSLHFIPHYRRTVLYQNIPTDLHIIMKYVKITANNHRWCTTPKNFTMFGFNKEWMITATSKLRDIEFISSFEHRKYPLIGVQFHPEKSGFEWIENQHNPHSFVALQANRYFYDVIVNLAKLNNHNFKDKESMMEALIYNYTPISSYNVTSFMQIYVF